METSKAVIYQVCKVLYPDYIVPVITRIMCITVETRIMCITVITCIIGNTAITRLMCITVETCIMCITVITRIMYITVITLCIMHITLCSSEPNAVVGSDKDSIEAGRPQSDPWYTDQ